MTLSNEFVVEAPIARVWHLMDELEEVVPCMPGAAYLGRDGEESKVSLKVKVGAISSNFQGTVRLVERDEATHTTALRGTARDLGGKASASATVVARLEALAPARTRVALTTDLAMTGRLAQFGGGVITDIATRLVAEFAENLHRAVIQPHGRAQPATSDATVGPAEVPALDLGAAARPALIRWALRYAAAPAVFFLLGWLAGRFL